MPASDMPVARERSRIEEPSYPFSQNTSVACSRILPSWRSKRGSAGGCRTARWARGLMAEEIIVRTFVLILLLTYASGKQEMPELVSQIGHQLLDLGLQIAGERK